MSKMVKKYILSIDSEAKEYFDNNILLIEKQLKDDIFKTPLVSSNKHITPIVKRNVEDFINTIISLVDYYTEGIFDSGKNVSRKKIKLEKQIPEKGQRYSFTKNDELFIDKYRSQKLSLLNSELDEAVVKYVVHNINNKIESKWRIDLEDVTELDYSKQELIDDEMDVIINIVKDCLSNVYDQIMDIVTREILVLFRRAQIEEYKNLGIDTLTTIIEDESLCCPICAVNSGKIKKLDDFIDDYGLKIGNEHSLCKYSIDPVISYQNQITNIYIDSTVNIHTEFNNSVNIDSLHLNNEIKSKIDFEIGSLKFKNVPIEVEYRITKLIKKFQIYAKSFLTDIEFIFVDNISDIDDWFKNVKQHYITTKNMNDFQATNEALKAQDNLKFKVASFDFGKIYYVSIMSFDSQLVEEILTRKLVTDRLKVDGWVQKRYDEKINSKHIGNGIVIYQDPFISYLSRETPEDYLLESVVYYINQPKKLRELDKQMFDYIKENVFNGIQFFK